MKEKSKLLLKKTIILVSILIFYVFSYYWILNNLHWVAIAHILLLVFFFYKLFLAKKFFEITFWAFCSATATILLFKTAHFWFGMQIKLC